MVTDGNQTYYDHHFPIYRNIKSQWYTPRTNIVLQVNYTQNKTNENTREKEILFVATRGEGKREGKQMRVVKR